MSIRRVVPDMASGDINRSVTFYRDVLGFEIGMDMGWVITLVSPDNPTAQITLVREDRTADVQPDITIEVEDVDHVHACARELGHEVVHPLTNESWGVRRFFVEDPNGKVINVMAHSR